MQQKEIVERIRRGMCWECTFRFCGRKWARDGSPVHVALPLHFKYPNLEAQSGPDREVSQVTGSPKSGSQSVCDNGET